MADNGPKLNLTSKTDHSVNWDWEDAHVSDSFTPTDGSSQDVSINDIVESGTVLVAAGPASLDAAVNADTDESGINIVPIGLVETAQISMNKPLSRIFEIGSKLSYIIPGRTVGGISLSRVFFDGPSILKAIYQGEVKADESTTDVKRVEFQSSPGKVQEVAHIGSGEMAMNLASSFFEQPVGLAFYFSDQETDIVSQIYFEGCRVSTYNLGVSANMNVLTESINMEFVRCRPIINVSTNINITGQLTDKNIIGGTLPE